MAKKYLIRMVDDRIPENSCYRVQYKRYKCIDGFNPNKDLCWRFSKQGALKIIERLKREYVRVLDHVSFSLVETEEERRILS